MSKLWPILVVVIANTFYNICAMQTPDDADPFFSLVITYGVAMVISFLLFLFSSGDRSIVHAFRRLDWTSWVFGLCIVALEFGYINIYRAGWQVNVASLIANISLAVILLFVGVLLYRESISVKQLIGVGVCALGLILIFRP